MRKFRITKFSCVIGLLVALISCGEDDDAESLPNGPIPEVIAFSMDSVVAGETIKITGKNFGTVASQNQVEFNGAIAIATKASENELEVVVPQGASTGQVTVTVNNISGTSAATLVVLIDIPRDGLIFFAPFDGNPNDLVNNIVVGVREVELVEDRFMRSNSAYNFNSPAGSCIYYSNIGLASEEAMTISLWVYVVELPATRVVDDAILYNVANGGYNVYIGGTTVQEYYASIGMLDSPNVVRENVQGGTPVVGEWTNITVTYNQSTLKLYLNDEEAGSTDLSIIMSEPPNTEMYVGAEGNRKFRQFEGYIDDITLYDRELSRDEISQLYNQTLTSR